MSETELRSARLTLGVPRGATEDAIRRATRRKARLHHPDLGGDVASMMRVLQARELLLAALHAGHGI